MPAVGPNKRQGSVRLYLARFVAPRSYHPVPSNVSAMPPFCLFTIQISYLEAILGNENVAVDVVDGSVEIKVPAGCQPETVLRIRGKGAPQLNSPKVRRIVVSCVLMFVAVSPPLLFFVFSGL